MEPKAFWKNYGEPIITGFGTEIMVIGFGLSYWFS